MADGLDRRRVAPELAGVAGPAWMIRVWWYF